MLSDDRHARRAGERATRRLSQVAPTFLKQWGEARFASRFPAHDLRLRPDRKLVCLRDWHDEAARLKGVSGLLQALVKLARAATPEAPPAPMPRPTPELVKARAGGRR
jgi:hypothetical protein